MMPSASAFGKLSPKFEESGTEVELNHIIVLQNEPEDLDIEQMSVVNYYRDWVSRGEHWIFSLRMNLFAYPDPRAKFNEIMAYQRTVIDRLWMHRDRDCFKDTLGNDAAFRLTIRPSWLESPNYYDILFLTFRSQKVIDISKSVIATPVSDLDVEVTDDLDRGVAIY